MSNMKQIGVGLELFVEDHKKYPIPDRDRYDYLVTDPNSINSGGVPRIETGLSPILYHGYLRLSMVFYSPAHQEFPILRQWYGPNFASAEPPYSRAGGYCYTPHASGESNWSIDDLRDAPAPSSGTHPRTLSNSSMVDYSLLPFMPTSTKTAGTAGVATTWSVGSPTIPTHRYSGPVACLIWMNCFIRHDK